MTFLLSRWRLIASILGLLGASLVLWQAHDYLASARVTRALEAQKKADVKNKKQQVKVLNEERDIERNDAQMVEKARESVAVLDWSDCPDVPAEYFRLLDRIGEEPSPGASSGEVPDTGTREGAAAGSGGSEEIPGGGEGR